MFFKIFDNYREASSKEIEELIQENKVNLYNYSDVKMRNEVKFLNSNNLHRKNRRNHTFKRKFHKRIKRYITINQKKPSHIQTV